MIKTVFLDRDGVINTHTPNGYVTSPDGLVILPGVPSAIKKLNDADIGVIIISNQQGVGKGLMTLSELDDIDQTMRESLAYSAGASILRSYYCTHLKDDQCDCRKPKGGQLRKAAAEYSISLFESVFVGDAPTDMLAGQDARIGHLALVLSGGTKSYVTGAWPVDPDSVHLDLASAVEWILLANDAEEYAVQK